MPKDLSNFFFFDGEKIEEMSKEIQSGKSSDFQNAVYSLVGLTATQNTIEHLKSNKKCVVKEIQREIDNNSKSAEKMEQKNTQIKELDEKIQNNTTELEKLQQEELGWRKNEEAKQTHY